MKFTSPKDTIIFPEQFLKIFNNPPKLAKSNRENRAPTRTEPPKRRQDDLQSQDDPKILPNGPVEDTKLVTNRAPYH